MAKKIAQEKGVAKESVFLDKLPKIGLKQQSEKIITELVNDQKTLNRFSLESKGIATDEIDKLIGSGILDEPKVPASEMQEATVKIPGLSDRKGFWLLLQYDVKWDKDEILQVEAVFPISLGEAKIEYDERIESSFKVFIKAPGGNFIKFKDSGDKRYILVAKDKLDKKEIELGNDGENEIKLVETNSKTIITPRLKGRLFSKDAASNLEKIQIIIQVSTDGKDYYSICHAVTEKNGYFFSSQVEIYQEDRESLHSAQALIGIPGVEPQKIRLTEIGGKKNLPENVILFIGDDSDESKNEEEEDCGCGCKEMDFHEKKTLEEFSFFTVVRTTEPRIEAYEISDIEKIDLKEIVSDPELKGKIGGYNLPLPVIRSFISKNGPITSLNVSNLLSVAKQYQQIETLKKLSRIKIGNFKKGRVDLANGNYDIDWDEKPTIYQATSIAHGHLLNFKQEWFNDGYSLGDLVYSLPLAPGQKKQIVVFDWDRKDSASNTQQLDYQESLYNSLSHDRDVNEVAKATLNEELSGKSKSLTWGAGGGYGAGAAIPIPVGPIVIPIGALVGVGGGVGGGSSSSSQNASRSTTASSQQHINDRTVQSANSVRSQRATVVQTVSQGERFEVSAEVVANYNHCHAMTIQYFEVLRHFEVRTRLADVQECLFIPLKLSPFDRKKALRWRDILSAGLKKRSLISGFDALERYNDAVETFGEGNREGIDSHYDQLGIPDKWYAEEALQYMEGELYLEFQIKMPKILPDVQQTLETAAWAAFGSIVGGDIMQNLFDFQLRNERKKDEAFAKYMGPKIADSIINGLNFFAVKNGQSFGQRLLPIDATLLSAFKNHTKLNVSLRMKGSFDGTLKREDIDFVKIAFGRSSSDTVINEDLDFLISQDYIRIIVHSGSMRYRTQNLHEHLFRDSFIKNDLTVNDHVNIFTPLSQRATKRPRLEDVEVSNALLYHLNELLEYYHQCIWLKMDEQRRFMLLDGIIAPGNSDGRSVASVVENKLIGIAGNSLVMPVAPGFKLDPLLSPDINLYEHYYEDPKDPFHVSLPTKGVFAEAVMGKCNSCEKKDESRFWRWEESPIPDSPTTINPVSLPTPQNIQPADLQPRDFPAPLINLQNASVLPDPQGYGSLINLLGNRNLFRDVTGLTENQKNALAALQAAFGTAEFFGGKAADLTNTAASLVPLTTKIQALDQIKKAKENGLLNSDQARKLTEQAFDSILNNTSSSTSQALDDLKKTKDSVDKNEITPERGKEVEDIIIDWENAKVEDVKATTKRKSALAKSDDLELLVTFRNTDGRILKGEDINWLEATFIFEGIGGPEHGTLHYSGSRFGAVVSEFKMASGTLAVQLADDSGGILFSGNSNFRLSRNSRGLSIDAKLDKKTISMTFKESESSTNVITLAIMAEMGTLFSSEVSAKLEGIIGASTKHEINAKIAAERSTSTSITNDQEVSVTMDVDIPTGGLTLSIAEID